MVISILFCSPTRSSKRPLLSNQFDLEPLLLKNDNHSTLLDDKDDADYIDDNEILEADQRPSASKRCKINLSARSSPTSRETRLSEKICLIEPVRQALGQAAKYH